MRKENKGDYINLEINGMHYVRDIVDTEGKFQAWLIIDNNNKPHKKAYQYLYYKFNRKGISPNALKRTAYDLCYFLDFLLFNNIDEEILTESYFTNFISEFLPQINTKFKVYDCIERSMLRKIPILDRYKPGKIKTIDTKKEKPLSKKSIERIANEAKNYLIYLKVEMYMNIDLNRLFTLVDIQINLQELLLAHLYKDILKAYSINKYLHKEGIVSTAYKITPIEQHQIFEQDEEEAFFNALNKYSYPVYQLLFYLISKTGMRITEALGIKIFNIPYKGLNIDFQNIDCDITLVDEKKNKWEVKIVVRKDNPVDLRIKGNKPRTIYFFDSTNKFKNLFTQYIISRTIILKKKRNKGSNEFLFVNTIGNRLKYPISKKSFDSMLIKAGLKDRMGQGQLVPHSLRHTFASKWARIVNMYKKDKELQGLSKYLGHANPTITKDTYIHFFNKDYEELLEKIDEVDNFDEEIIEEFIDVDSNFNPYEE